MLFVKKKNDYFLFKTGIQGVLASRGFLGEEEIRELQIRELQVMF